MSWDARIHADARQLPIADQSVQCVVTSPPYWGLRDYGNPDQIGLERTPDEYVSTMVMVFREVWRVLKPGGTLWLNLGDSYAGSWGNYSNDRDVERFGAPTRRPPASKLWRAGSGRADGIVDERGQRNHNGNGAVCGLKPKDLCGIPWRIAFALQEDGWYLRSDIIWHKPNPMPESVTDRPTRVHEYIFLLTKSARYFYDAEAIAERAIYAAPNSPDAIKSPYGQGFTRRAVDSRLGEAIGTGRPRYDDKGMGSCPSGLAGGNGETRNKRSVWTISTQPYPEAHYATFPEEIPEICIKAGSRVGDLVLDPFFGSGTVGRVAERLNRRWVGCDLAYHDLQAKRLQNVQKEIPFESSPADRRLPDPVAGPPRVLALAYRTFCF